jgi:hypothetical protein
MPFELTGRVTQRIWDDIIGLQPAPSPGRLGQYVDRRRTESVDELASHSGLGRLGDVLWHVGVLPDRHLDHNGRSWSTRG